MPGQQALTKPHTLGMELILRMIWGMAFIGSVDLEEVGAQEGEMGKRETQATAARVTAE